MKKSLITLFVGAAMAVSVNANADEKALGGISGGAFAAGALGAVFVGIATNGRTPVYQTGGGTNPPPVELGCEGDDPLVDGVCVGTTTTVTVTGTGTNTFTTTVPVTYTYPAQ